MNTISMAGYRTFHKFHPLTLLAQLSSRQTSGCLKVSTGSASWAIYLEKGKLLYAAHSADPFERLDRHLRRLSVQAPSLVSAVRVQVRLLFERSLDASTTPVPEYRAICWLVEQQHLHSIQAGTLVEGLAQEVIESFLAIQEGSYELVEVDELQGLERFCRLDLRPLVEHCQTQLRQHQTSGRIITSLLDRAKPQPQAPSQNEPKVYSVPEPTPKPAIASIPSWSSNTQNTRDAQPTKPVAASAKGTFTVACIDDSPAVLQAINSFLDDKIFTVLMINNPVSALMQIVRSKPDLILLDVTMPNLDGYELCSLLRRHPHLKQTPVIMVTGNTGFIDRAKAKLVGASGYLTKPFTQSDLIKMVFKHLHLT
jgi:two-component system, chemotaxis family, response regulator PixG